MSRRVRNLNGVVKKADKVFLLSSDAPNKPTNWKIRDRMIAERAKRVRFPLEGAIHGTLREYTGRTYRMAADGSIRRVDPQRPWRGKSERRRVLRERREARHA